MSNVGGVRPNNPVVGTDTQEVAASMPATSTIGLSSTLFKDKPALREVAEGGEIAFGARGDGARLIQQALKQLGNPTLSTDGIYGRGTQAAVAAFQRANGLNPSGTVDQRTLAKLDEKLGAAGTPTPPRPTGPVDNSILFVGMG